MFADFFKASRSRTLGGGKNYRLFRRDSWSSNGYWAIKEDFEPDYIKELKSTKEGEEAPKIVETVTKAEAEDIYELKPTGNLKLVGSVIVIELETLLKEQPFTIWVNAFYYTLFESMEWYHKHFVYPHFFAAGENSPIIVKTKDGDTIGLIMPVRQK